MLIPFDDLCRFWRKVLIGKEGECWQWIGSCGGSYHYGQFYYKGKSHQAHRVSWEIKNGTIPDGLYACHTCDNTICVNPNHLFLGTAKDNHDDAVRKGRINTTERGKIGGSSPREKYRNRTITDEYAAEILNKINTRGSKSLKNLSKDEGISMGLIIYSKYRVHKAKKRGGDGNRSHYYPDGRKRGLRKNLSN